MYFCTGRSCRNTPTRVHGPTVPTFKVPRPKPITHRLDVLPLLGEDSLVVDGARGDPCLDLVSQPLQLLDLLLEVLLVLLLLVRVRRIPHLLEVLLELVGSFHHLLQAPVDLGCKNKSIGGHFSRKLRIILYLYQTRMQIDRSIVESIGIICGINGLNEVEITSWPN